MITIRYLARSIRRLGESILLSLSFQHAAGQRNKDLSPIERLPPEIMREIIPYTPESVLALRLVISKLQPSAPLLLKQPDKVFERLLMPKKLYITEAIVSSPLPLQSSRML